MLKKSLLIFSVFLINNTLNAEDGASIANKFEISASAKVSAIWERIFDRKKYKKIFPRSKRSIFLPDFKTLSQSDLENLKNYLIEHAADSAKPKVAGEL